MCHYSDTSRFALIEEVACKLLSSLVLNGEPSRARTCDPLIKSQLLYQLSYRPTTEVRIIRGQPAESSKQLDLSKGNDSIGWLAPQEAPRYRTGSGSDRISRSTLKVAVLEEDASRKLVDPRFRSLPLTVLYQAPASPLTSWSRFRCAISAFSALGGEGLLQEALK